MAETASFAAVEAATDISVNVNTAPGKIVAAQSQRVTSSRLPFRYPVDSQAENRFHFLEALIECERTGKEKKGWKSWGESAHESNLILEVCSCHCREQDCFLAGVFVVNSA